MVYDCFTFFNELDLLEIRLNILDGVVDKFVLVEATRTFSNLKKSLYYQENIERFKKYEHKIIHVIVDDFPKFNDAWGYEYYQRNAIERGLSECENNDTIIISDLDEIPNPDKIKKYKNSPGVTVFAQKMYYYYLNFIDIRKPLWGVISSKMLTYKNFKKYNCKAQIVRFLNGKIVLNGGWHFSYLGGEEIISQKMKSFAHSEYNHDEFTNLETISWKIKNGFDLFLKHDYVKFVNFGDKFLPQYVLNNKEKYKGLFTNIQNNKAYYKFIFFINYLKNVVFLKIRKIIKFCILSNKLKVQKILKKELLGCKKIIDLGCGNDIPLGFVNNGEANGVVYTVGVGVFTPYLLQNIEKNKIHSEYINKNIFELDYPDNSFDVALLFDVIEHFEKDDFLNFFPKLEKMAKKIILITPNGFFEQEEYDGNPHQKHLSGWTVTELKEMGFKCYGLSGLKLVHKIKNHKLKTLLADLSQIFLFRLPGLSFQLIAIKDNTKKIT